MLSWAVRMIEHVSKRDRQGLSVNNGIDNEKFSSLRFPSSDHAGRGGDDDTV